MLLQQQLAQSLAVLEPQYIDIINESSGHGGYYPGKESHFKLIIVSLAFEGLRAVQRHQLIYKHLGDLMSAGKIHALAIHAYLPEEWQQQAPTSPQCAHAPNT